MKILNLIIDGLLVVLACICGLAAIPPGLLAAFLIDCCRATNDLVKSRP